MNISELNNLNDEDFMGKILTSSYDGDDKTIQKMLMLPHLKKKISQNRDFAYMGMLGACSSNQLEIFNKLYNYCVKNIIGFSEEYIIFLYYTASLTKSMDCLKEIDNIYKISHKLMGSTEEFKLTEEYKNICKKFEKMKDEYWWASSNIKNIDRYKDHILITAIDNNSIILVKYLLEYVENIDNKLIEEIMLKSLKQNSIEIINEFVFSDKKIIKEDSILILKKLKENMVLNTQVEKIILKIDLEEILDNKTEIKRNKL